MTTLANSGGGNDGDHQKFGDACRENLLAVLPIRDIVIFPGSIVPLFVGRKKSVMALEYATQSVSNAAQGRTKAESNHEGGKIILVAQRDSIIEDPQASDIHQVGTESRILQTLRMPDGTLKVIFEGVSRTKLSELGDEESGFFKAHSEVVHDYSDPSAEKDMESLCQTVKDEFANYVKINKKLPVDALNNMLKIKNPGKLADTIGVYLTLSAESRQKILETFDVLERLELILSFIETETGALNTDRCIRNRVKNQMEKTQREYYLNEQLKAIYRELGDGDEAKSDANLFEKKIASLDMSSEARDKALSELKKFKTMNPMSSEATVVRSYLEWLLSVPWEEKQEIDIDLDAAQEELDRSHYGMEKVKEHIIECLAVQQRTKSLKGSVLCLLGAPGVGKTSLAMAIAKATGRKFAKISLGGVRDESEIRGHRRTYVGAMPGKIIQSLKKVGTRSPLFLLDEIDKMGHDFRGDPAAAMLEVLDPEQNVRFNDHYMEIDYDLSDVMFIATANSLSTITRPLLDRMEIISVPSYTEEEKLHIANDYIIKKHEETYGLKPCELKISPEAIRQLIRCYAREAGVRGLGRQLAKIARKSVKAILTDKVSAVHVTLANLSKFCGVPRYDFGVKEKHNMVGVSTGLAYTEVGGELLSIEAARIEGDAKIRCTGKLGKVMQESVQAAYSYIRSRRAHLGLTAEQVKHSEIHLHVPEGATPKDGPSAGIAICVAVLSSLSGIPVLCSVAMTGEITLRGNVLPIGGLREKLLAALRGGITTVIIPQANVKDLADVPANVKRSLKIKAVSTVDEVLAIALAQKVVPLISSDSDTMRIDKPGHENEGMFIPPLQQPTRSSDTGDVI